MQYTSTCAYVHWYQLACLSMIGANHRAGVGGIVFDDAGRILVVQERFPFGGVPMWKLPGGHVDQGLQTMLQFGLST